MQFITFHTASLGKTHWIVEQESVIRGPRAQKINFSPTKNQNVGQKSKIKPKFWISGTDSYVFGVEESDFQGPGAKKSQKTSKIQNFAKIEK